MKRWVAIFAALLLAGIGAVAFLWWHSPDPRYAIHEMLAGGRYRKYDDLIVQAANRYHVEPELIKAIVWRESRFQPDKVGTEGERGLMQVTVRAASDWAKAEKIETFDPASLFDPSINLQAGTWYLSRALAHWQSKDDPVPFALAEYNAGRGRVQRWVKNSGQGETAKAGDLQAAMDFPGTKTYISAIVNRRDFYKNRHEFQQSAPLPSP